MTHRLVRATKTAAGKISLAWPEKAPVELHPLWLRLNDPSQATKNQQRLFEMSRVVTGGISSHVADCVSAATELKVSWGDGAQSTYPWDWLERQVHPKEVERYLWGSRFSRFLPEISYKDLNTQTGKLQLCTYLQRYGLGVIRGVDVQKGMVEKVSNQIGHVRVTNYGSIFDVQDKGAEATNLAFTSQRIRAHTDNPYRDPFPGVQLLHCLQSAAEGGATLFIDGFRVAEELRKQDAEAFRLLATTKHPFEYRDPDEGVLLRATSPVIQLGQGDAVERITFNNRSAAALPASFPHFKEYYKAWAAFDALANSEDFSVKLLMRPGDLAIWLNGRVMHGRESYQPGGPRHIQGAYLDQDEINSTVLSALAEGVDLDAFDVHRRRADVCMEALRSLPKTGEADLLAQARRRAAAAQKSGARSDVVLACLMHPAFSHPDAPKMWAAAAEAQGVQPPHFAEPGSAMVTMGFSSDVVDCAELLEKVLCLEKLSGPEQAKVMGMPQAETLLPYADAGYGNTAAAPLESFQNLLHEHFRRQSS